jgi:hypothetical protein
MDTFFTINTIEIRIFEILVAAYLDTDATACRESSWQK